MAKALEDAGLDLVRVGARDFPIGPVTIHQLHRAKNLIVQIVADSRARQAKREAELVVQVANDMKNQEADVRSEIAKRLGVGTEDLDEALYLNELAQVMQHRMKLEEAETGYGGQIGMLLDALAGVSEHQLLQLAVILLDRRPSSQVTHEFVEAHFNLDWFTEALAIFVESNNIQSIVKNSQRLGAAISMQISLASTTQAGK